MKITLKNRLCTADPSSPWRLMEMFRRPDPTIFFSSRLRLSTLTVALTFSYLLITHGTVEWRCFSRWNSGTMTARYTRRSVQWSMSCSTTLMKGTFSNLRVHLYKKLLKLPFLSAQFKIEIKKLDTKVHKIILFFLEFNISASKHTFFSSLKSLIHLSAHFCLFFVASIFFCAL